MEGLFGIWDLNIIFIVLYVKLFLTFDLVFRRSVAVAHVNLGLICLLHRGQYSQAVHHFSAAIKVDPLCIRAYLCRAQAYRQVPFCFVINPIMYCKNSE